ncbi:MAG: hypothetical protein RBU45_05805 [Myxococcota bacterium]|jgi:hypothetical protein|nr:hypothetical protein [Myxococcota bacterium]
MSKSAGWMTFLLTTLWAGLALAQKAPGNAVGISTPEPSLLLYAAAGALPLWWVFRRR